MTPTCQTCRFFHPWEPDQKSIRGGLMGNCQARPPQLIEQRLDHGATRLMTKYAAVSSTDPGCGAHEVKPPAHIVYTAEQLSEARAKLMEHAQAMKASLLAPRITAWRRFTAWLRKS